MFLIEFFIPNLGQIYFCIPEIFEKKTVFEYKNTLWTCILELWIHKDYFVVKKLVWNVHIKVFWYTNDLFSVDFILKLFDILYPWYLISIESRIQKVNDPMKQILLKN